MRPVKIATYDTCKPDPKKITPKKVNTPGLPKKSDSVLAVLKDLADKVHRAFVRKRDTDAFGFAVCITCKTRLPARVMEVGHYVRRAENIVRWHEYNSALQCVICNHEGQGMPVEFARAIDQRYGNGTADKLIKMGKEPYKLDRVEVQSVIDKYKKK
jgi:hypothetical protein